MIVNVSLSKKLESLKCFPKLMINNDGLLILFLKYAEGTVIYGEWYTYTKGHYCKCVNMDNFTDYEGEVTLKNE